MPVDCHYSEVCSPLLDNRLLRTSESSNGSNGSNSNNGSNGTSHSRLSDDFSSVFSLRSGSDLTESTQPTASFSCGRPRFPLPRPSQQDRILPPVPCGSTPLPVAPPVNPPVVTAPSNVSPRVPRRPVPAAPVNHYRNEGVQWKHKWKLRSRSRRLLTMFSAGTFLLSLASFALFIFMLFGNTEVPGEDSMTCVLCSHLLRYESDTQNAELIKSLTKTQDGKQCCARTSSQLSSLLNLVLQQTLQEREPNPQVINSTVRFSPASAHIMLQQPSGMKDGVVSFRSKSPFHYRLQNNPREPEHTRNVKLKKNSLEIVHGGLYFVYSAIYFRSPADKKTLPEKEWRHYVAKRRLNEANFSGILLETVHTNCNGSNMRECQHEHHSSYVAGVFDLKAGDTVFVKVNGVGIVKLERESSFLGLFMLASTPRK